jgi:hypothetical protein
LQRLFAQRFRCVVAAAAAAAAAAARFVKWTGVRTRFRDWIVPGYIALSQFAAFWQDLERNGKRKWLMSFCYVIISTSPISY